MSVRAHLEYDAIGPIERAPSFFERIAARLRLARRAAELRRELSGLDDRDLDDLGIARCDIPEFAAAAARDLEG